MPFTKTIEARSYQPRPEPQVEGTEIQYVMRELREVSITLNNHQKAIKEMQDYLATLP